MGNFQKEKRKHIGQKEENRKRKVILQTGKLGSREGALTF